uniref:Uncharacterized protein n=1 Tax=Oryza punctata TaxID=4537 RepID=A0A0E0JDY8_ORYPU
MKYFDCTRSAIRSPFDDDVVYQFEYMEYIPDFAFGIDDAFSYKYNQKLGNCGEDGLAISCEHGTCHVVPAGIDEMVSISLRRLMEDESAKEHLCQSILAQSGIRQFRPYPSPLELVRAADPLSDAWRGAAAFAASSKFGRHTFSLADYREHGENLFHRYNIAYSL